jgi:hypothetical protein
MGHLIARWTRGYPTNGTMAMPLKLSTRSVRLVDYCCLQRRVALALIGSVRRSARVAGSDGQSGEHAKAGRGRPEKTPFMS